MACDLALHHDCSGLTWFQLSMEPCGGAALYTYFMAPLSRRAAREQHPIAHHPTIEMFWQGIFICHHPIALHSSTVCASRYGPLTGAFINPLRDAFVSLFPPFFFLSQAHAHAGNLLGIQTNAVPTTHNISQCQLLFSTT